jgi:hypothetical protein
MKILRGFGIGVNPYNPNENIKGVWGIYPPFYIFRKIKYINKIDLENFYLMYIYGEQKTNCQTIIH